MIAEGEPDAVGKCIGVAIENPGSFFVLRHVVKEVAGDGEHIGLLGGNAAQQGIEFGDGKETAEMDVADLREAVPLPRSEPFDWNREAALDSRLTFPEAAVNAETSGHGGIDGCMTEKAPAALVDGHGHHAAPEEADDDCYKNKGRADELRHEADDDRLDDEARPRYEMVDDGAANEPAHADGVEQQHDDAHPTQ